MKKFNFFWKTMELCAWEYEGDDEQVLWPVIQYLSKQEDTIIFKFDDIMSELLYDIDTKEMMEQCEKVTDYVSDDLFLYSRCVALINGPDYYERVKSGREETVWDMEFEALLYVPQEAWALKHQRDSSEYPYCAPLSYETGSNKEGWKQ